MGKHATHLLQRSSPLAPNLHKPSRYATRLTQHQKSSYVVRPVRARSPGHRSRLHSTNTARFLSSRSQLSTICEEPEEEELPELGHRPRFDRPRDLYACRDNAQPGPSGTRGLEDDVDMLGWDDETTLVAMLQDGTSEQDEEEQIIALVEQLKAPMAAQGAVLKQYLKDTLLPAYNSIKTAHDVLDDKVDLAFGAGLLTFDEVCKKVERIALRDEDELKTAHVQSQKNFTKILEELEEAYGRRKQLWTTLEADLDRCATRATGALEALSADVEQTITLLEKKSKAMDKDTGASANQKVLRNLLEKL